MWRRVLGRTVLYLFKVLCSFETPADTRPLSQRHNAQHFSLQLHRCKEFRSRKYVLNFNVVATFLATDKKIVLHQLCRFTYGLLNGEETNTSVRTRYNRHRHIIIKINCKIRQFFYWCHSFSNFYKFLFLFLDSCDLYRLTFHKVRILSTN